MAKFAVPLSFLGTFTITLESDNSDPTFLEAEAKDILWRVLDGGNVDYHTESIELEANGLTSDEEPEPRDFIVVLEETVHYTLRVDGQTSEDAAIEQAKAIWAQSEDPFGDFQGEGLGVELHEIREADE